VVRTDGSDLTGDRLLNWLASGITAVIVERTDTLAAVKALQATAEAAGLRYPEDFSLAMTGEQVYPDPNALVITGFAVPRRAMGREAVRLLVSMLGRDEVDDANRQQLLRCSFIEGDTSGPPPAPGPNGGTSYHDAVGVGSYRIDLHPSTGGDNYIDVGSVPFEIPLGALLPIRVRNLLPAAKNIGTTHITNGCYRLHPVEWNIGEVVGWLAAFCLDHRLEPHQVRAHEQLLAEFQQTLDRAGVERHWPDVRGY
jgi:hypothetical protein